jgi:competence protein ComEC
MHLALVGGGAFFLLAWGLAAIEPLARRMNVRKLAAAGALAVSFGYLMISGAEAPAVRSFVMAGMAFAAILVDRRALTQRGVALAALAILAVAPENASAPGFQMSFAAVVALVAANDLIRARRRGGSWEPQPREIGVVGAIKRFLFGLTSTSLVAGLATAPFAAFHFNRTAAMGLISNLIAMPIFSGVVMPMAALAGLLTPFGLEEVPAWIAARAIDVVVFIGETTAAQPGALGTIASAPALALGLAAMAIVAGSIVRRGRWRIAAPLALFAAVAWPSAPEGDLWIGEEGGWVARAETADGVVWIGETGRGEDYGAELFARRAGYEGAPLLSPAESGVFACDAAACVGRIGGRTLSVADAWSAVVEDCARGADIVLTPGRAPARVVARCAGVELIPRRGRGDRGGVIDMKADEIELLIARGEGRPWRPS